MDKYYEQDKEMVVNTLNDIKCKISKVIGTDSDKSVIMNTISDCMHEVAKLGIKLNHVDGMDIDNAVTDNTYGLAVVHGTMSELCKDIDQSVGDTSWIEDLDTFKENQKEAVRAVTEALKSSDMDPISRSNAEHQLDEFKKHLPEDDAPEWVVRSMRNEMLLMGLKSQLNSILINLAEL